MTTALALVGMLYALDAAAETSIGLARAAGLVALIAVPLFVIADLALPAGAAAVSGLVAYAAALALVRPRGLVDSLRYLRQLA